MRNSLSDSESMQDRSKEIGSRFGDTLITHIERKNCSEVEIRHSYLSVKFFTTIGDFNFTK